jgi:hypothetical protein
MTWEGWLNENWQPLANGAKVSVPSMLPPLSHGGFRPIRSAAPEGQSADWALPLTDRSRVHVHAYSDGRRVAHRDKHDPDLGFADMIAHLLFDTPLGVVVLAGSVVLAIGTSKAS